MLVVGLLLAVMVTGYEYWLIGHCSIPLLVIWLALMATFVAGVVYCQVADWSLFGYSLSLAATADTSLLVVHG